VESPDNSKFADDMSAPAPRAGVAFLEELVEAWGDSLVLTTRRQLEAEIVSQVLDDLRTRVRGDLARLGSGAEGPSPDDAVHQAVIELPTILAAYLESRRLAAPDTKQDARGFRSYLMGAARNIVRDLVGGSRRHRARLARLAESYPSRLERTPTTPSQLEIRVEVRELLEAELAKLDPLDRTLLQEHAQGRTLADLGRELGIPRETARDRYQAAAARLRRIVERALGGEP